MADFRVAVLNPGGNDANQEFPDGAGSPAMSGHAPVNYHAYAACTQGWFLRSMESVREQPVILLLTRHLVRALRVLRKLRAQDRIVAVALKEAGSHQIAQLLDSAKNIALFQTIAQEANGALASTPELVSLFAGAGARHTAFIPTPYPIEEAAWDFSVPMEKRRGIFIGTREFFVPSRRHLAALFAAKTLSRKTGESVTVVNGDGRAGRAMLRELNFSEGRLNIIEGRASYAEYLRLVAQHRIVWQLDRSRVPGQVAGDALLCRVPCIGGDGAVDRLAFPELHGAGREEGPLVAIAERLLKQSEPLRINSALAFSTVRRQLRDFFEKL